MGVWTRATSWLLLLLVDAEVAEFGAQEGVITALVDGACALRGLPTGCHVLLAWQLQGVHWQHISACKLLLPFPDREWATSVAHLKETVDAFFQT